MIYKGIKPYPSHHSITRTRYGGLSEMYHNPDVLKHFVILGCSPYSFNKLIRSGLIEGLVYSISSITELLSLRIDMRNVKNDSLLLCCAIHLLKQTNIVTSNDINKICGIPTDLFKLMNLVAHNPDFRSLQNINDLYQMYNNNPYKKKRNRRKKQTKDPGDSVTEEINRMEGMDPKSNMEEHSDEKELDRFIRSNKFIHDWYNDDNKTSLDLLYLMTKYKRRCGWDHETILRGKRFTFPKKVDDAEGGDRSVVKRYILKKKDAFISTGKKGRNDTENGCGNESLRDFLENGNVPPGLNSFKSRVLTAMEALEKCKEGNAEEIIKKIIRFKRDKGAATGARQREDFDVENSSRNIVLSGGNIASDLRLFKCDFNNCEEPLDRFHICYEHLPTRYVKYKKVCSALLQDIPIISLVERINAMSSLKLFDDEQNKEHLLTYLKCPRRLKCIHPLQILKAVVSYRKQMNKAGTLTWVKKVEIDDALGHAFCQSFMDNSNRTNYSYQVCIDASTSMLLEGFLACEGLSGAFAAYAIARVIQIVNDETSIYTCKEESTEVLRTVELLSSEQQNTLCHDKKDEENDEAIRIKSDLSKPITAAISERNHFDAFIIFTKSISEELIGNPYEEFKRYQAEVNSNAKLIICQMEVCTELIADPEDPCVKILCGVDSWLLKEISNFMN